MLKEERKFLFNPFKEILESPIIYMIYNKNGELIERVFGYNNEKKKEFKKILKDYEKKGKITIKKHKNWISNFKGYAKYTIINKRTIPIKEYVFIPR